MSNPDIVVVFTATNVVEAEVIKGLLEASGIPAVIEDEALAVVLDGIATGNLGIDVHVPSSAREEAERVIAAAREVGKLNLSDADGGEGKEEE